MYHSISNMVSEETVLVVPPVKLNKVKRDVHISLSLFLDQIAKFIMIMGICTLHYCVGLLKKSFDGARRTIHPRHFETSSLCTSGAFSADRGVAVQSKQNRRWLPAAYGDVVGGAILPDKPTLCSGAINGEQVALETYIRAMMAESDQTGTVQECADQGFHNYLYHSHKFQSAETIYRYIVSWCLT
jgi:hypothetical protein